MEKAVSTNPEAVQNGKALEKYLARKKNPRSEIEQLRFQAANALMKLRGFAKTDLTALEVLASELQFHVRGMNCDALEKPEHYRRLARKCPTWPAAVSVDKEIQKEQVWFARAMQLGADGPLNYTGKQWSRSTPEIVATLRLISWINGRQDNLPPLTRTTAARWWKHARPLFEEIYGKRFETYPLFATHYQQTPTRRRQAMDKGLKFETWQRQQILTKMAQAFRNIARKN